MSASPSTDLVSPGLAVWEDARRHSALDDLPYKVESNRHGQLVLRPHKNWHSFAQGILYDLLRDLLDGEGARGVEFAIVTPDGVKAPDVVWMSDARRAALPSDPTTLAPELCIEVVSASNTEAEIAHKRALYFDAGAEEVWTCDEAGRLRFFDADGTRATSALVPGAPTTIEV